MFRFCFVTSIVTLMSVPASAATMQAVYVGTIASGSDGQGLFGGVGSSLAGLSFSMTFIYDTTQGTKIVDVPSQSVAAHQNIFGGSWDPANPVSPMLSASFTVNGVTQAIAGSEDGFVDLFKAGPQFVPNPWRPSYMVDQWQTGATDASFGTNGTYINNSLWAALDDYSLGLPLDLDTSFSLTGLASSDQVLFQGLNGGFSFMHQYVDANGVLTMTSTQGFLVSDTLTVSALTPAPVPLPASGLLLLAGLGGMVVSRRNRGRRV